MFLNIALLSAPYTVLTYQSLEVFPDTFWQKGLRVIVPLGRKKESWRTGIIVEADTVNTLSPKITVKPVLWPLELQPFLTGDLLELIGQMARRQGEEFGQIARGFLPLGLRNLSLVLHTVENNRRRLVELADIAQASQKQRALWAAELLQGKATLVPKKQAASDEENYDLACDPPWPVRPHATVQIEILEYLFNHGPQNRKQLATALGSGAPAAIKKLCEAGHLRLSVDSDEEALSCTSRELLPPAERPFTLTQAQEAAVAALSKLLHQAQAANALLFGVTGSGKTAVYLALARICLEAGQSVFLLVPEVALAFKLLNDTRTLSPELPVVFYHGYQSITQRESTWRSMEKNGPCLVIGTRSALFLPVEKLGLVILDEEHDASFKQEDGLRYHAKEIAWFRAQQHRALLLLGSATPDVRTYYAADAGRLEILRLPDRISGQKLPPIELVDVRESKSLSESVPLLARNSLEILQATIARGEQAVILINRRGFSPHMYCLECGKTERCPDCEIGLTYHKSRGRLVCHYCGFSRPFPSPCSSCGSASFLPMGQGTERLSEELSSVLGQNVLRLDRDSTRRPGQLEAILTAFAHEEAQVLVGTQMLSKGHHFPKVTLVIAADADMGLNLPDYRASERTFQLLLQTAGRAGRGSLPGRVLLQTRDLEHYCWKYLLANDYEGFYATEIERRKKYHYPPFSRLALLRLSHAREEDKARDELSLLAHELGKACQERGVQLLGPCPSPLAMLRGRKRFQCLLKSQDWGAIRAAYAQSLSQAKCKILRVSLDLDPVNML
ncbi:MAG: primosomal protein N' [Desulfovibrio sp.]|nr:primosomal protein N' [Desulfovibrio sp.]